MQWHVKTTCFLAPASKPPAFGASDGTDSMPQSGTEYGFSNYLLLFFKFFDVTKTSSTIKKCLSKYKHSFAIFPPTRVVADACKQAYGCACYLQSLAAMRGIHVPAKRRHSALSVFRFIFLRQQLSLLFIVHCVQPPPL